MIRGKFLTSMNADMTKDVYDLRKRVFSEEYGCPEAGDEDRYDAMSVYALVYNEEGVPSGAGRLYIDEDGHFCIGRVGVLKEARGQGMGDLLMRMLLYRAQELNAPSVYLTAPVDTVAFFGKYGPEPYGEIVMDEGRAQRKMKAAAEQINLEGTCGGRHPCADCTADCARCEEGAQN